MDSPEATPTETGSLDPVEDPILPNPNHARSIGTSEDVSEVDALCTLYLASHGHRFGPIALPTPSAGHDAQKVLQYDIRGLPNPPKNVRAQQTGLHKALREWFFSRPESVAKLEEVSADLDVALEEVSRTGARRAEIHVVVFCEMGKHRSVAFIEELARRPFFVAAAEGRERCAVVVQHRDVTRGKHDARSKRQRTDRSGM
ncbi:hypothetical protein K438DRAFT_2015163 [Mycena galopus ATCC 62051]|nr:hypothetical protein K438DRAFT_2015163 [Mycena galopus ATCC 62051]